MKITKHIGVDQSGAHIALILPLLPNTQDCLVVSLDALPDHLRETFDIALRSAEGQAVTNLTEVLDRQTYSDTRVSLLRNLHDLGFISKRSIDDITMIPNSLYKIPLREILIQTGILIEESSAEIAKYNPHAYNAQAASVGEALGSAHNLLAEADLLDQSAAQKREQAYRIAPSLRPGYKEAVVESIDLPKASPEVPVELD